MAYDLAVIGSGAAGFAAAITARTHGRSVVMIEGGIVGGTCVNTGCVPSKALLTAAEARHNAREQRFPGIATSANPTDLATLGAATHTLTEALRTEKYTDLATLYGWDLLAGHARFASAESGPVLEIDRTDGRTERVEAEYYLIAAGASPWAPPIAGLDEAGYLTSTTALELDALPDSMIVLGGNAVGLEQAQLWARLGVRVTLVEAQDRLAPFDEAEIGQTLAEVFADEDITVHTATTVTAVHRDPSGYILTATEHDRPIEVRAEHLLVATGRRPATAGLNLAAVGVHIGRHGEIEVDAYQRTSNPRIWAAGDVTGSPQFVYVAGAQGTLVADNAFGDAERTLNYDHLPRVTFTTPVIAAVGLTDADAIAAGIACDCRVLPLRHVPRALVNRDTLGLIKLVADRDTGRLLGVHVLAEGAGDLIATAVTALEQRMTVRQLAEQWCPYLTMAEGLQLAAQTFTRDVATLSCCAA